MMRPASPSTLLTGSTSCFPGTSPPKTLPQPLNILLKCPLKNRWTLHRSAQTQKCTLPHLVNRAGPHAYHLPGVHPLLWAAPQEGNLHRMADHCEEANGCQAQSHQGRATEPNA